MDVNSVPAGAVTNGFSSSAAVEPLDTGEPTIASDFETFLRMLTVQLENQDPLNPQKAEDFAVQLATFSGVEQAVYTNSLLEDLMGSMTLSSVSDLANWIGNEARAPVPAEFDGATPIEVVPNPNPEANEAFLVVRDQYGLEIERSPIPVTDDPILWDGTTASGASAPAGVYSFEVESWIDGSLDAATTADVYAPVTEARIENGEAVLVMAGRGSIAADKVTALRAPETP